MSDNLGEDLEQTHDNDKPMTALEALRKWENARECLAKSSDELENNKLSTALLYIERHLANDERLQITAMLANALRRLKVELKLRDDAVVATLKQHGLL